MIYFMNKISYKAAGGYGPPHTYTEAELFYYT